MPAHDGRAEAVSVGGIATQMLAQMPEGERHMAAFVLKGEMGDLGGDRVGSVAVQKRQKGEKGSFSQDRKQEGCHGPVRLIEQRLQRGPTAGAGNAELPAGETGSAGKDLDMPGLVGDLGGQELNNFAEVRVDPAEEAGRDHQGGLLVFDQVGHHLHHSSFDIVGKPGRRPIDQPVGIPLAGGRLGVQLGRQLRPDDLPVVQVGADQGGPPASTRAPRTARPQVAGGRSTTAPGLPALTAPASRRSPASPRTMTLPSARWPRARAQGPRCTARFGSVPTIWTRSPGRRGASARSSNSWPPASRPKRPSWISRSVSVGDHLTLGVIEVEPVDGAVQLDVARCPPGQPLGEPFEIQ